MFEEESITESIDRDDPLHGHKGMLRSTSVLTTGTARSGTSGRRSMGPLKSESHKEYILPSNVQSGRRVSASGEIQKPKITSKEAKKS